MCFGVDTHAVVPCCMHHMIWLGVLALATVVAVIHAMGSIIEPTIVVGHIGRVSSTIGGWNKIGVAVSCPSLG